MMKREAMLKKNQKYLTYPDQTQNLAETREHAQNQRIIGVHQRVERSIWAHAQYLLQVDVGWRGWDGGQVGSGQQRRVFPYIFGNDDTVIRSALIGYFLLDFMLLY